MVWKDDVSVSSDDAAGDFFAGISGGLSVEIICHSVYDDCPSKYFTDGKTGCYYSTPCRPIVYKKRGKVTGMRRMFAAIRVVVAACVCKGVVICSGAGGTLVNMESQNRISAASGLEGDAEKGRGHENGIPDIIKGDEAPQGIVLFRTHDMGGSLWGGVVQNSSDTSRIIHFYSHSFHIILY